MSHRQQKCTGRGLQTLSGFPKPQKIATKSSNILRRSSFSASWVLVVVKLRHKTLDQSLLRVLMSNKYRTALCADCTANIRSIALLGRWVSQFYPTSITP